MQEESNGLTFFAWSDTHFGYEQRLGADDIRGSAIEQMNELPCRPWLEGIEGVVGEPDFVLHCGDVITAGPDAEQKLRCYETFLKRLRFPSYETLGNHDMAPAFVDFFLKKHGAKSYAFDRKGIRFLCLHSVYDDKEVGRIEAEDLRWLGRRLEATAADKPIVLFTHCRLDCLKNGGDVRPALKARRVILVVSGHKHAAAAFDLDGIACLSVGHCRNHPIDREFARSFYVVRIRDGRIDAAPWRWDLISWQPPQRSEEADPTRQFMLSTAF